MITNKFKIIITILLVILLGSANALFSAELCSPAAVTSVPFTKDGVGEFCWETTSLCSYINSWNLATLEINGTPYLNTYVAASSIAPVNGKFVIHYVSIVAWGHFEIGGTCGSVATATTVTRTATATTVTRTATATTVTRTATTTAITRTATATRTATTRTATIVTRTATRTITATTVTRTATPTATSTSSVSNSAAYVKLLGVGWNAGNTLDAIGGETAWGNPLLNQTLFNAVKAAGFKSVRLPVAWSQFSDSTNYVISTTWLARVKEVINMALNAGLYVMVNEHWDGGWMNQPTYANQASINNRLKIMWQQIAAYLNDIDNRLIFAGTNEVMMEGDYGTPTVEYYTVQNSFNQTFVTAVRGTGGNNASRYLAVQGFNTNIDHCVNYFVMPTDTIANRLIVEVHYYDPYNFTLNTSSSITQWGVIATDPTKVESWANETWLDGQFQKMKTKFVDQGVGVIVGEFCVAARFSVSDFETYRVYFNKYLAQSAVSHGLSPMYWDAGSPYADAASGIFDRTTGAQVYPNIITALVSAK